MHRRQLAVSIASSTGAWRTSGQKETSILGSRSRDDEGSHAKILVLLCATNLRDKDSKRPQTAGQII